MAEILSYEQFNEIYEKVDNAYSIMIDTLQELANDYGVAINGRLSVDNLEKDFNSRFIMERNIDIKPCEI